MPSTPQATEITHLRDAPLLQASLQWARALRWGARGEENQAMPFADSGGIRIYYDDTGEGEPVLLCLPGWCNDHTIFAPLAERLRSDYRVLAMDWRGHGDSQASDRDFGFPENAVDALAVVEASGAHSVIPVAQGQAPWVTIELRQRLGGHLPQWEPAGIPLSGGDPGVAVLRALARRG